MFPRKNPMKHVNSVYSKNPGLMDACRDHCRERCLRPYSVDVYANVIQRFMRETGVTTPDQITVNILLAWRDDVAARSSVTTFNNYFRHLRAILNTCVRKRYINENPILLIEQFRNDNKRRKACTAQELTILCQHLNKDTDNPLSLFTLRAVITIYYTGMRRSQLCGLRWSDIDFDRHTIFYRGEHSKNGKAWSIPLHRDLMMILFNMKHEAKGLLYNFREADQVFCVQRWCPRFKGVRMTPEQFSDILKRAARRCGVKVSSHRIRHLMATILANQGSEDLKPGDIPLTLVSLKDLLGHKDISTTISYIEPRLASQRKMLEGLKGFGEILSIAS